MKNKLLFAIIGIMAIVLIVLLGGLVASTLMTQSRINTTNNAVVNSINSTTNNTTTPIPQKLSYSNNFISFKYPSAWSVTEASDSAVNVTNGKYILYINPQALQASGVTGGRFSEIAMGAPGADLVIKTHPSNPCGKEITGLNFAGYEAQTRQDLYIDTTETSDNCNLPTNGKELWYFSYITNTDKHFFNYYVDGEAKAYVITMTYKADTINELPVKDSAELTSMLTQMTEIIASLEVKQK